MYHVSCTDDFNSRLHTGVDGRDLIDTALEMISTHDSTRESTKINQAVPGYFNDFNSRLHTGVDANTGQLWNRIYISTHDSTREST